MAKRNPFSRLKILGARSDIRLMLLVFIGAWLVCAWLCFFSIVEMTKWPHWLAIMLALPGGVMLLLLCIWMAE
jgi:hypothetical protein